MAADSRQGAHEWPQTDFSRHSVVLDEIKSGGPWLYGKAFAGRDGTWLSRGLAYAATGGVLSWSFTTIAVAAKNLMTSVPDYLLIETAFTVVQWIIVGPLTALAFASE